VAAYRGAQYPPCAPQAELSREKYVPFERRGR